MKRAGLVVAILVGLIVIASAVYTVGETEQVIITQFGEPIGSAITLTQRDVRQLQLAKGAIRTGIQALLQANGLTDGDIEQVVMLFPAVRPGDQIEFTLVREVDPAMDGEFSTFLPIADPWPVATVRRELSGCSRRVSRISPASGVTDPNRKRPANCS